jgi:hypothetical protein
MIAFALPAQMCAVAINVERPASRSEREATERLP